MFQLVAVTPGPGSTTLENNQLCETCQSLFDTEVTELLLNTTVEPEHDLERAHLLCSEVLASSKTCYLCRWIVETTYFSRRGSGTCAFLGSALPGDFTNSSGDPRVSILFSSNAKGALSMRIESKESRLISINQAYATRFGRMTDSRLLNLEARLMAPTGGYISSLTVPQIQEWLNNCLQSHETCSATQDTAACPLVRPSRLLEISNNHQGLGARVIRLRDHEKASPMKYLTLSHCWGDTVGCKLLSSNMHLYKRQIPLQDLTRTFMEAIQLTQNLGFSYLWIDALCIVQDSEQDWKAECKKMGDIYTGGLLNIAATSSSHGDHGLFSNSYPKELPTFLLRFRDEGTPKEVIFSPCQKDRCYRVRVEVSPLGSRGWVLQERLLSPRTIHFITDQVLWECHVCSESEILPVDLSRDLREPEVQSHLEVLAKSPFNKYSTQHAHDEEVAIDTMYNTWKNVVRTYSVCKISFPSDKLPALSGLASRMAKQWGIDERGNYLAGLWRDALHLGLVWYAFLGADDYYPSRAPSWSWAYIDAAVTHPEQCDPEPPATVPASTQTDSDDPYGAAPSGSLVILAPLCIIRLTTCPKRKPTPKQRSDNWLVRIGKFTGTGIDDELNLLLPGWSIWWDYWDPRDELSSDAWDKIQLVGVICNPSDSFTWGGLNTTLLVLQPTGRRSGQYKRVGLARVVFGDDVGKGKMWTLGKPKVPNTLISHLGFEGGKGYTIEIV